MDTGLIAILIILAVIVFSIITRRSFECMFAGGLIGAWILYGTDFLSQYVTLMQETAADQIWLILVTGFFGGLIALLQASKGSFGFSKIVARFCKNERRTLLTSFVLGIVIFVDDYLNVLSIGACMKSIYDKRKLPRESLAYILDSTGAPVCVLLPISTWSIFFASTFFEQECVQELGYSSGVQAYIHAIPFCFYPIAAILIVFLFAMGWIPKLGGMKKAFQRVEETGKVYSDASKKYNMSEETYEDGNPWLFLIPMIILVALTLISGDLLLALIATLIVCFVLYVSTKAIELKDFSVLICKGFADMIPVLLLIIVCFTLGSVAQNMGMSDFIINTISPYLNRELFPVITFLLVAFLTFSSGNLWGMCVIVAEIVFPLVPILNANTILVMAAIISGGAFGSHACFYTDATLLSASSAGIDNIEHAVSQLPYVIIGAVIAVIGFTITGFIM